MFSRHGQMPLNYAPVNVNCRTCTPITSSAGQKLTKFMVSWNLISWPIMPCNVWNWIRIRSVLTCTLKYNVKRGQKTATVYRFDLIGAQRTRLFWVCFWVDLLTSVRMSPKPVLRTLPTRRVHSPLSPMLPVSCMLSASGINYEDTFNFGADFLQLPECHMEHMHVSVLNRTHLAHLAVDLHAMPCRIEKPRPVSV